MYVTNPVFGKDLTFRFRAGHFSQNSILTGVVLLNHGHFLWQLFFFRAGQGAKTNTLTCPCAWVVKAIHKLPHPRSCKGHHDEEAHDSFYLQHPGQEDQGGHGCARREHDPRLERGSALRRQLGPPRSVIFLRNLELGSVVPVAFPDSGIFAMVAVVRFWKINWAGFMPITAKALN